MEGADPFVPLHRIIMYITITSYIEINGLCTFSNFNCPKTKLSWFIENPDKIRK